MTNLLNQVLTGVKSILQLQYKCGKWKPFNSNIINIADFHNEKLGTLLEDGIHTLPQRKRSD